MGRPVLQSGYILVGLLLSLCCSAQKKPMNLTDLMIGLEHHPQIQSAYVTFTRVQNTTEYGYQRDPTIQRFSNPPVRSEKMVSAFKGELRFHRTFPMQERKTFSRNTILFVETEVYDGKQSWRRESSEANPDYYTRSQVDSRNLTMAYTPLYEAYYHGKGWWCDYLKRNKCELEGTFEDKQFGTLAIIRCQEGPDSAVRIWFAPKYGFMAVRIEPVSFTPKVHAAWRVTQVAQQDDIWLPVEEKSESSEMYQGHDQLISSYTLKDAHYQINQVPDSLFLVKLPTGSTLWEPQTQTMYDIEEGGKRVVQVNPTQQQNAIMKQSLMFIVMIMIITGMGLRYKRRHLI